MSRLAHLARHARALTPHALPPDVARRAVLHHLSTAAALRVARPDDTRAWPLLETAGGEASLTDAARLVALRAYDDPAFFGPAAAAAVLGAWAAGGGAGSVDPRSRAELLVTATVAGLELAGRVGIAAGPGPGPVQGRLRVAAVAVAGAVGWLRGLDDERLAHALALALEDLPDVPVDTLRAWPARGDALAEAVGRGWRAVEAASGGEDGDVERLDGPRPEGFPLAWALGALDVVWFSRTLTFGLVPAAPALHAAVQATDEIVRRHRKAAGKPLRPDQVERVEIALDHRVTPQALPVPGAGPPDDGALPFALAHAVGVLVATTRGGPALFDPGVLAREEAGIRRVAERVEVRSDARLSARRVRHEAGGLVARLLAIATARDEAEGAPLHLCRPVRVTVHTVRGGRWVEARDVVEGGPEYPLAELEHDVVDKYAEACGWRRGEVDAGAADAARARADGALSLAGTLPGPLGAR